MNPDHGLPQSTNDLPGHRPPLGLGLLAVAMTLPGMQCAYADTPPESAVLSWKYGNYRDWQPDADRLHVTEHATMLTVPIAGAWSVTGAYTTDALSGASPQYHTFALANLNDRRRLTDLAATAYFPQGTVSVSGFYSEELDYESRGASVQGTLSSEDKNTTWNLGLGGNDDTINPSNQIVTNEKKHVADLIAGVTQVLTVRDIVQLNLGYSQGRGYFSEPYKIYDNRPRERDHTTVLARWNHHFSDLGGSARLSYRYYTDTFGIRSHTLGLEYVQALPYGFVVTPTLRGYSQHAADFFVEVDPNAEPFATNPPQGAQFYSEDQRLASFGALTVGIKVAKEFGTHWLADVRYERYEQRNDWYVGGSGSQYLANLSSRWFQVGISYTF